MMLRATTAGIIESVGVQRGSHGTSAPKISFSYSVDGHRHNSDRFSPGFFTGGTWTGGGRAADDYDVGQTVVVHYDPLHAEDACLAYGWNPWSVGLPLFLAGMSLQGWGGRRGGRRGNIARVVGWTLAPLGIACFALIRDVLRPSDLPIAAGIGMAVFAANLLFRFLKSWTNH